jgi:hypothetical protein
MNDEVNSGYLEERLRREAQELTACRVGKGDPAWLQAELQRRRRQTLRRSTLAVCLAASFAGASGWWMWNKNAIAPSIAESVNPAPVAPKEHSRESPSAPSVAVAEEQPELPRVGAPGPASAVPFLVTDLKDENQRVIAVGVYIPPRTQRVSLNDLPPLQRAAVCRVLGLDEEPAKPTI